MTVLTLRQAPGAVRHMGLLQMGRHCFPCVLGEAGITVFKREGDRATPAGRLKITDGYFRRDRMMRPHTRLTLRALNENDGWCDDPAAPQYNRQVKLPCPASCETLWRDDRLYDVCLVLDWNLRPRKRDGGSAIFLHQSAPDGKPTLGCIALEPETMRKFLRVVPKRTVIRVLP